VHRVLCSAVAVVFAGTLLAGCGGNHNTEDFSINATVVNGHPAFSAATITVTQGDKVNISVGNTTGEAHGFSIDQFNVHQVVQPGHHQTVSFTPNATGQFRIYCQLHPAHVPSRLIVVG